MKKLTIWLMILLVSQLAFAQGDSRSFVSAQQHYAVGNYETAKHTLTLLDPIEMRSPEYALLRGKVHLALGEYQEAHTWLSNYGKNSLSPDPMVKPELLDMIYKASLYQEISPIAVTLGKPKGKLNSHDSEYAPVFTPDGKYMYFSSLRRSEFAKENIFITTHSNMVWATPEEVDELCTDNNESLGSFSKDGKVAYLFGYYSKSGTNGDIYSSTLQNNRWSSPSLISSVSSDFYDLQPHVHNDEVMIFTSNRHGTNDNYDLFISFRRNGTWTAPVNLGDVINTDQNEQSAFISPCGRYLYFASDGHPGFGGYDIFVSQRTDDTWLNWSKPQNMGPIINSVKDDRYYVISPDTQYAYLSSNRSGGIGQEDIYYLDLALLKRIQDMVDQPQSEIVEIDQYHISGLVTDSRDRPIPTEVVWTYRLGNDVYMRIIPSDGMGAFNFVLPPNATDLSYQVDEPGYQKVEGAIELPEDTDQVHVKITCPPDDGQARRSLVVNGRVLDENNQPVTSLLRWTYILRDELNDVLVEADEQGRFKLYLPSVERLKYAIDHPGYAPRDEVVDIPEGINSYDSIIRLVSLGNEITISGQVTSMEGYPLAANLIWAYEKDDELVAYRVISDAQGNYKVTMPRNQSFAYRVAKTNYMQISGDLSPEEGQRELNQDFVLSRLVADQVFELENVEFEFNEATLTQASLEILQAVLETMRSNPSLEIELSGHTDNIGARAYNLRLSDARAKAVGDFLIQNGISASRISSVGYGFDQPIASNDSPEGRQRNRRTELKILGIEYIDESEDWAQEFMDASRPSRMVRTIESGTTRQSSQVGIPIALEDEFRSMILSEIRNLAQAIVKVDIFMDNGKIQSVNVTDLRGNLSESQNAAIADLMLGWQVQNKHRSIYSFTVRK